VESRNGVQHCLALRCRESALWDWEYDQPSRMLDRILGGCYAPTLLGRRVSWRK